jgi:hypothetical protein
MIHIGIQEHDQENTIIIYLQTLQGYLVKQNGFKLHRILPQVDRSLN